MGVATSALLAAAFVAVAVACREIEAKKARLDVAKAEGRGEEVALQEAADAALQKIRGFKVLVYHRPHT